MPSRLRAEFQPEEIAAVLARFDVGEVERIEREPGGSRRSPKLIVTSRRGRFLLKRRARGRDHPLKVSASHAVQRHLATRGFPLPRLISPVGNDDTLVIFNGCIYELFEYVSGAKYDGSPEATFDAGRVLGSFHSCLRDYQSEWEPSRRGYHDNPVVRGNLNGIPASLRNDDSVAGRESELLGTVSILYDAYETASERVNAAGWQDWRHQLAHADWHPGNMLFVNKRVRAVIDYDSLHMLPTAADLANGALQFSILGGPVDPREWPAELDEGRFRRFVLGYRQARRIRPEVLAILPWLMIEALIAEAVMPIAATGSFGRIEGFRFLRMIARKVRWFEQNAHRLTRDLDV